MGDYAFASDASNFLKEYYASGPVRDLCMDATHFLKDTKKTDVTKSTKLEGKKYIVPVKYNLGNGFGVTVADSQTVQTQSGSAGDYEQWEVTPQKFYATRKIEGLTMAAAEKKGVGSFVEIAKEVIDDMRRQMAIELEVAAFRGVSMAKGKIATNGISSNTVTLDNPRDVVNLKKGDLIQLAAAETSGSLRDSGDYARITSIDAINGKFTVNDLSLINGAAAGDFIFKYGTRNKGLNGLLGHTPIDRSSAVTVQGVDLSSDWTRLAGLYLAAGGKSPSQVLQEGMDLAEQFGAKPTKFVCNPYVKKELALDAGNYRVIEGKENNIGFSKTVLVSSVGEIEIVSTPYCPRDFAWAYTSDVEFAHWSKDLMQLEERDGNIFTRVSNDDAFEVRLISYVDLVVPNPSDVVFFNFGA